MKTYCILIKDNTNIYVDCYSLFPSVGSIYLASDYFSRFGNIVLVPRDPLLCTEIRHRPSPKWGRRGIFIM